MGKHAKYTYRKPLDGEFDDKRIMARAVLNEHSRYSIVELRRLRAERGVGPVSLIDQDVRDKFKPTKRTQ